MRHWLIEIPCETGEGEATFKRTRRFVVVAAQVGTAAAAAASLVCKETPTPRIGTIDGQPAEMVYELPQGDD